MPLEQVTLENLKEIGLEVVTEMFAGELDLVVRDMVGRPGDKSSRKVTIEFEFVPTATQQGVCDGALGRVLCYAKIPKQKTRQYSFGASPNGQLVFRPDSPQQVRQLTLNDIPPKNEETEDD